MGGRRSPFAKLASRSRSMRTLTRPAAIGSLVAISALLLVACQPGYGVSSEPSAASSSEPSAASSSEPSAAPSSATGLTLTVVQTVAGDALAGPDGMTLYIFANDTDGTSTCTGDCATNWPPLLGDGAQVTAGDGVSGSFGTTTRDDGSQQVTLDGQPLYYFAGDSAPGDSNGDGVLGLWSIAPAGDGAAGSQSESPSATPYELPY